MLIKLAFNIARRTYSNMQTFDTLENILRFSSKCCNLHVNHSHPQQNFNSIIFKRFKNGGKTSKQDNDEEDSIDDDAIPDYLNTEMSKIITVTVPSLRLDAVAKVGLGISRTKLDKEFYKGNVRVNGEKYFKKSRMVQVGDEIDFIQCRSPTNSKYLIINRCVLASLEVNPDRETINVKLVQNKSLIIEDYMDQWSENK